MMDRTCRMHHFNLGGIQWKLWILSLMPYSYGDRRPPQMFSAALFINVLIYHALYRDLLEHLFSKVYSW
jgi:hypothetical protein